MGEKKKGKEKRRLVKRRGTEKEKQKEKWERKRGASRTCPGVPEALKVSHDHQCWRLSDRSRESLET